MVQYGPKNINYHMTLLFDDYYIENKVYCFQAFYDMASANK